MGADGVLRVRDGNHSGTAGQTNGGFDADDAVGIGGTNDAAIGFAAERDCGKVRRRCRARTRAGAARIAINAVRIVGLSASARPTADGFERSKIGPFGEIRLPKNHSASGAQICGHSGVMQGRHADERKRPSAGLHFVAGANVVFEQHRNSV